MSPEEIKKIKVGDRVKVSCIARYGRTTAVRKVRSVDPNWTIHPITVSLLGYQDFYVKGTEIIEHYPQ
jgi:hypothetical protein